MNINAWLLGISGLIIIIGLSVYISRSNAYHPTNPVSYTEPSEEVKDTTSIKEAIPENSTIPIITSPDVSGKKALFTPEEFDATMTDFIKEAKNARRVLWSGEASDSRLREIMYALGESYTSTYNALLSSCKSENPDIPGLDIELDIANASEKSNATKLWQETVQAIADTIKARHPESYTDD